MNKWLGIVRQGIQSRCLWRCVSVWMVASVCAAAGAQEPQLLSGSGPAAATAQAVSCEAPGAMCNQDGLCVDLMSDPDHCGACGNSCGGSACERGSCSTRWSRSGFALGLNLGGLWGETKAKTDGFAAQDIKFKPYTPNHWLLSAQVGRRGPRMSAGLRIGFSTFSDEASQLKFRYSLMRIGPFVGVNVYQVDLGPINLAASVEASLYIDMLRSKLEPELASAYKLTWLSLVPSLGAGLDVGVWQGLRVGFYGGMNFNLPLTASSSDEGRSGKPAEPKFLFGGEFRATLQYKFGAGAKAMSTLYALLRARFAQEGAEGREAYAFGTPHYESAYAGFRKVAVAAPSSCENRSTSGGSRMGMNVGDQGTRAATEVLATQCGVEMAMLERVLAENGYTVTSWRTIAASSGEKTPIELARQYGAEVLFQVNSLERTSRARGDGEVTYEWRRADAWGHAGAMLPSSVQLSGEDIRQLNEIALRNQGQLNRGQVSGVMADVNAIDVNSGENIWLYRWERPVPSAEKQEGDVLVRSRFREPSTRRWETTFPIAAKPTPLTPTAPELVTQVNVSAGNAPDANKAQDLLLESIVRDFVNKFRTGTGRQAVPLVMPPLAPAPASNALPVAPAAPPAATLAQPPAR